MAFPSFAFAGSAPAGSVFLAAAILGGLAGGVGAAFVAYFFSRRLFKSEVMRELLQDVRGPVSAYMDWLSEVSAEFALWKSDLLPAYVPDSSRDQFELNRMRKLFVDRRHQGWLDKLEAYDTLLAKFAPALKAIWLRHAALLEDFGQVFRDLEADPPEAARRGERIENQAFGQNQLISDFLYHLQYECLRPAATARPRRPEAIVKPRIVRTATGRIRVEGPAERGNGI